MHMSLVIQDMQLSLTFFLTPIGNMFMFILYVYLYKQNMFKITHTRTAETQISLFISTVWSSSRLFNS